LRIVYVQTARIGHDLAGGVDFHMRAVHGPRRGTLEVDGFRIVTAAVTRAFELVLGRLPLGGATKMCTDGINDEEPVRLLDDPDTIGHQEFLIHAQGKIRREADGEDGIGFVKRPRKEEAQEHKEVDTEIAANGRPDHPPAHAVGRSSCPGLFGAGLRRGLGCRNGSGSGGFSC
jgi:hypothetical protein